MSPLLRKEIRLQLAPWLLGVASVALPFVLQRFTFFAAMILAAVSVFGREVTNGTFSGLLALPVERRALWRVKLLLLLLVFVSASLVMWLSLWSTDYSSDRVSVHLLALAFAAVGAAICSTGVWSTLVFRQVPVAVCFAILIPLAISLAISVYAPDTTNDGRPRVWIATAVTLGLYSLAGLVFARELFLKAQDKQWSGGVVVLPGFLSKTHARSRRTWARREWRPIAALFRKELQLQHGTLLLAGGIALLHVIAVVTRITLREKLAGSNITTVLLETFGLAWLFIPLMAGCTAVADERRNEMAATQLCLPTSSRKQLWIKFGAALVISMCGGALAQTAIESIGFIWGERQLPFGDIPSLLAVATTASASIFFVSFYASTLTRSTIGALSFGLTFSALLFIGFQLTHSQPSDIQGFVWPRILMRWITPPVLVVTLALLIGANFRAAQITAALLRRNAIAVVGTLAVVFGSTSIFYNRTWELVMPLESAHGPARWTLRDPLKFSAGANYAAARLPDGRLWLDFRRFIPRKVLFGKFSLGEWADESAFVVGTNWHDVAAAAYRCVAIQRDGTLWTIGAETGAGFSVTQLGTNRDWHSVSAGLAHFLLLKRDGSLWVSVGNDLQQSNVQSPVLLNRDTNWASGFSFGHSSTAVKRDGSVWQWHFDYAKAKTNVLSEMVPKQLAGFGKDGALMIDSDSDLRIGIQPDHTLVVWGDYVPVALLNPGRPSGFITTNLFAPLDREPAWRDAACGYGVAKLIIGLKSDGTLWQWRAHLDWKSRTRPVTYAKTRVGRHSDWLAIEAHNSWPIALAADGSVWMLPQDVPIAPALQRPSRKPMKVATIGN